MNVEEDPEYSERYPEQTNCRLEITTTSGQHLTALAAYPKGHPNIPMSDAEIEAKFRSIAADLIPAKQCDRALDLLWALEEQPNLDELFDVLLQDQHGSDLAQLRHWTIFKIATLEERARITP